MEKDKTMAEIAEKGGREAVEKIARSASSTLAAVSYGIVYPGEMEIAERRLKEAVEFLSPNLDQEREAVGYVWEAGRR